MDSTDINDLESLQRAVRRGLRPTYLFFWGHTAGSNRGAVGKECLSQWYGAPFTLDGHTFPTVSEPCS